MKAMSQRLKLWVNHGVVGQADAVWYITKRQINMFLYHSLTERLSQVRIIRKAHLKQKRDIFGVERHFLLSQMVIQVI